MDPPAVLDLDPLLALAVCGKSIPHPDAKCAVVTKRIKRKDSTRETKHLLFHVSLFLH